MFSRRRVIDQVLSPTLKQVELPRDAVIDEITLLLKIILSNSDTANEQTATYEEILKAISSIRVISNGSNVHVSLPAHLIALVNYYDNMGKAPVLTDKVSVPAGGTATVEVPLIIDFGDIHAHLKDSLVIGFDHTPTVNTNISITDVQGFISIKEIVFEDPEEYIEIYGPEGEGIAEPKVYSIVKSFDAQSELKPVLDLPVGAVLYRGIILTEDTAGARANLIDKLALELRRGALEKIFEERWTVLQHLDKVRYNVEPYTGVAILDYGEEITANGIGIPMLGAQKGDLVLSAKTIASGKLVYISHEIVTANPEAMVEELEV